MTIESETIMGTQPLFVLRYGPAQAYGEPVQSGEFLVRANSTAMRDGSAKVKREQLVRDRLVRDGILVADADPRLLRFAVDQVFSSASQAAGVVRDGNSSGPQLWKNHKTGQSLKDYKSIL